MEIPIATGDRYDLPHIGLNNDEALAYEDHSGIHVFTGALFQPSFMLLLRRHSPDDFELRSLVNGLPIDMLRDLLERYCDISDTDMWTRSAFLGRSLTARLIHAIETAEIQLYWFAREERERLFDYTDPLFARPLDDPTSQAPAGLSDAEALELTRLQLATELGRILEPRWRSKDAFDAQYHSHGLGMRALILTGGLMHAAGEAVHASVQGLADTAETLYDGLSGVVVTIHESGRSGLRFIHEINAQGWSRVEEAVQALGLAIDGDVERIKTLAATGYDIYQTLLGDRQTRMLLLDFIAGWWESIADIDSMRGLVSVAVTVAVELLIALALAVTAVGAASAALNLARRIGGLSSNALQLLGRIYILLERMTRRLAAERPPAATNPAGHASADARRPQARADQHQQADQEGLEGARQSQNVATNKNVGGAGGNWNVIDEVADSSVIQQVNDLSCGQACVGMILGDREINASQEVIAKLAGDGPTYEAQLASVLNKLDSSNSRQWIGAGVDAEDVGTFHGLSSTGSWGAQLLEKGNKIGHWVVVDGLDDAGRVIVRDPWQATKYRMDLTEFQNTWTGYSVWGQ